MIKGSVPEMIHRTLEKLQDMVIYEKVTKVSYQKEAVRRVSYPYQALEEAVVNAFYHRDYMSYQSIIIEIEPELVRIISFPGIDCSISMKTIEDGERFSTRYYRNKRLGELLKELDLTEGKSIGVPTIQEELRKIGSPKAKFTTDVDRCAVTVDFEVIVPKLRKPTKQVVSVFENGNLSVNEALIKALKINCFEIRLDKKGQSTMLLIPGGKTITDMGKIVV